LYPKKTAKAGTMQKKQKNQKIIEEKEK